jgi:hypothetical protein
MAEEVAEATDSLPKETGIARLLKEMKEFRALH